MITVESLQDDTLRITLSGKLEESDFAKAAAQLDPRIRTMGKIRLLIDATGFEGWADRHAAGKHFGFVRDRQKNIERIALIAAHEWQHWIAGIVSVFVHPEVKVFDPGQQPQAESWLKKLMAA